MALATKLIAVDLNILIKYTKITTQQFYRLIVVNNLIYLYLKLDVRLFLLLFTRVYLPLCVEAKIQQHN